MKKRKLKKSFKSILIIVFIFSILGMSLILIKDRNKEKESKIDIVNTVYEKLKDKNIDINFLTWINDNYEESLDKLNFLLEENEYDQRLWHKVTGNSYIVLNDLYNKKYEEFNNAKIIKTGDVATISFVGDVSLADNWYIAPKYDERGKGVLGILSEDILDIMTKSDVMVVNSEFTVSNRGTPMYGKAYTFRAKPERLSIYHEMGVDLALLANNHVYDFGKDAFLDMLDAFNEHNIPYIGAGRNLDEAKKPYFFIVNGYKLAFINATRAEKNIMTPGADDNNPGVFRCYDTTNMVNEIKKLKEESDFVIANVHYGKEFSHQLEEEQIKSSKEYIDAGADLVVGHHAHVLQGIEFYNDKPIIYNLGNFIFNEETTDTAIFKINLNYDGSMEYYIIPALQKNEYTDILSGDEKQRVINDINSWSINAKIDSDGKINKNV